MNIGINVKQPQVNLNILKSSIEKDLGVTTQDSVTPQSEEAIDGSTLSVAAKETLNDDIGAKQTEKRYPIVNPKPTVTDRPHGIKQIKQVFGEPGTSIVKEWMPAGPGGKMIQVECHKKVAPKLKKVFNEIKAKGLSKHIKTYNDCYIYRKMRNGSKWSTHAWGVAVDLNAKDNWLGRTNQSADQKKLAQVFTKHGFFQHPRDPMHFQYCTGYGY